MATTVEISKNTFWSLPCTERAWPNIFIGVMRALGHESRIRGDASNQGISLSEPNGKDHQRLRDIWNCVQRSAASLVSLQPSGFAGASTLPLFWSLRETRPSFISKVLSAIDQEPVEDGFEHQAEKILAEGISEQRDEVIMWLKLLATEENDSYVLASVIKCMGRIIENECPEWGYEVLLRALKHPDVEVRDAAAQSLELLGTPTAMELLNNHSETVSWLKDYIDRVILQWVQR